MTTDQTRLGNKRPSVEQSAPKRSLLAGAPTSPHHPRRHPEAPPRQQLLDASYLQPVTSEPLVKLVGLRAIGQAIDLHCGTYSRVATVMILEL